MDPRVVAAALSGPARSDSAASYRGSSSIQLSSELEGLREAGLALEISQDRVHTQI